MGRGSSGASGGAGGGGGGTSQLAVKKEFQDKVQAFQDAGNDQTKVQSALSSLKSYLIDNIQVSENGVSKSDMFIQRLFNVSGNRVWYQNTAGTLHILAPNGEWLKFNPKGGVYHVGKINPKDKKRVQVLANQLHNG